MPRSLAIGTGRSRLFGRRRRTSQAWTPPKPLLGKRRSDSDEWWVLDLCDQVLGVKGHRQYRFDWLLGDRSEKTGRRAALPVDGYWERPGLAMEFAERQHDEATPFFDKPDRVTVSGVHRGLQRRLYGNSGTAPANWFGTRRPGSRSSASTYPG